MADLPIHKDLGPSINYVKLFGQFLTSPSPSSHVVTKIQTPSNIIIISDLPLTERSRFLVHAASGPTCSCYWARNERCGTEALWPQFSGKLVSGFVPQPLARQAWDTCRCLAVS